MKDTLRPAFILFAALSLICCLVYPYAITGIGQIIFPYQANGSLIQKNGRTIGSALIGQSFSSPRYFWGRPSATGPMPNNAAASGGSNLGPSNPALPDSVKSRIAALKRLDPDNTLPIPVDLVSASASGLDPEISVAAANYQAPRIARLRKLPLAAVLKLISSHAQVQHLGFFGEPRINVLALNMALDEQH
ncbi:potassium-transporting ATPase subunit KdpC [Paralcaligenes sp. KSB-10]|uniref:potassium-transporting ATPase subunit KdpC n=1 Tax=Paralcaligenes sp. KSB-10 TaxID=2901142 RepID=UPI001E60AE75|nr:potassium-transporting ATPase subunit KdpC [Paralcaligenes sp. KSB-10]UHL64713.1 potassium-transporting ATPase subunit KdpC [Paralcaligenes sp. KSB-10]